MVVHTGTCQLEIIWNLIQQNSEDNYEFFNLVLKCWEAHSKHTHSVGHRSFTVRKSKRFHFLEDLELQWNLSSIYYNPLAAIRTTEEYKYLMPDPTLTGHVYRWRAHSCNQKAVSFNGTKIWNQIEIPIWTIQVQRWIVQIAILDWFSP